VRPKAALSNDFGMSLDQAAAAGIPGFAGTIVWPGDRDYDAARAIWNAMHDRRPALVARCTSARDVAAAVCFGRDRGLRIAVRCGGHSLPGFSVCDDGIVVDLRGLNAVNVDPVARRVTVGGGALLRELDQATQAHGLVVPTGNVSHTGLGGLALGGGVGHLMRRFGLTIDSLVSAEVVTADGRILRASADEHPDLFWGIRGGGGNFGVVTQFEFTLHELSEVMVLVMFHEVAEARAAFERAEQTMVADTPDELWWACLLGKAPAMPWIPSSLTGAPGAISFVEWSGDLADGHVLLSALNGELAPAATLHTVMPFLALQTVTDYMAPHGLNSYIKAGLATELSDGLIDALLEHAGQVMSPVSQIEMLAMGGAIGRVDPAATAFPHRNSRWLFNAHATWASPDDTDAELAWLRRTFAALEPHLSGGAYVNMMGDSDGVAGTGAHSGTLRRLQAVKAAYDPDNVFRLNQNIAPVPVSRTEITAA
jgi:FAD/FMN-containing dehydrogenase